MEKRDDDLVVVQGLSVDASTVVVRRDVGGNLPGRTGGALRPPLPRLRRVLAGVRGGAPASVVGSGAFEVGPGDIVCTPTGTDPRRDGVDETLEGFWLEGAHPRRRPDRAPARIAGGCGGHVVGSSTEDASERPDLATPRGGVGADGPGATSRTPTRAPSRWSRAPRSRRRAPLPARGDRASRLVAGEQPADERKSASTLRSSDAVAIVRCHGCSSSGSIRRCSTRIGSRGHRLRRDRGTHDFRLGWIDARRVGPAASWSSTHRGR